MYEKMWLLLIDARARFFKEEQLKTQKGFLKQKAAIDKMNEEKLARNLEE